MKVQYAYYPSFIIGQLFLFLGSFKNKKRNSTQKGKGKKRKDFHDFLLRICPPLLRSCHWHHAWWHGFIYSYYQFSHLRKNDNDKCDMVLNKSVIVSFDFGEKRKKEKGFKE